MPETGSSFNRYTPEEYFRLCISPLPILESDQSIGSVRVYVRGCRPEVFGLSSGDQLRAWLCDEKGDPLFSRDPGQVLPLGTLQRLSDGVSDLVLALNPSPYLKGYKEARERLQEGAKHWSNALTGRTLGESFEVTPSGRILSRPERFWGIPANQLLSSHLAAFEVCRSLILETWNTND